MGEDLFFFLAVIAVLNLSFLRPVLHMLFQSWDDHNLKADYISDPPKSFRISTFNSSTLTETNKGCCVWGVRGSGGLEAEKPVTLWGHLTITTRSPSMSLAMCSVHIREQLTKIQNRSCPWTRFNKCFYYLFPTAQYSSTAPQGISDKTLSRIKN